MSFATTRSRLAMPVIDYSVITTVPGAGEAHPFSPPAGFRGDSAAYTRLLRQRICDPGLYHPYGQRIYAAAWAARAIDPEFRGPFATEARRFLTHLKQTAAIDLATPMH